MEPIVVVKFGGTSVAAEQGRRQAAGRIQAILRQGRRVVTVVSAMGRRGDPYATDTLLDLLDREREPARTQDMLSSCGEVISACVFAQTLERQEIPAWPMSGLSAKIQTNGAYSSAEITYMDTRKVEQLLDRGMVPVITGFQGVSPDHEITTLGRGGSDTSAVTIGGFLNAEAVCIFTDVPGVAVADPRVVPGVRYLPELDYEDCLLLAECGAKVLHPRSVRTARDMGVPLWVRSTFDSQPGTRIGRLERAAEGLVGIASRGEDGGETVSYLLRGGEAGPVVPEHCTLAEERPVKDRGRLIRLRTDREHAPGAVRAVYQHFVTL